VMTGHAPFMSVIRSGDIVIHKTQGAATTHIRVEGGFAEVSESGLTVLAEKATEAA
jgi:F-type H+-transporting ATPase subunit epsilon